VRIVIRDGYGRNEREVQKRLKRYQGRKNGVEAAETIQKRMERDIGRKNGTEVSRMRQKVKKKYGG